MAVAQLRAYLSPSNERWRRMAAGRLGLSLVEYDRVMAARKKICGWCRSILPADVGHFGRCRQTWDCLNSVCRVCRADYDRVRRALLSDADLRRLVGARGRR